ncbi:exosortase F system-associated protein [Flavobacterium cyanobacteriorum]|uniref:Exosortase F system-associated protein n=1 Tax=Flavobacterium cyanobacteriorum TaxID=2022802 RepID=A0A255ZY47_9FLAO|nr:exosortase F system-associated protein [Flavobacterium cyanobacteriorum]OYQ46477.1 exosortase F system-associated protein [Flavobacterium cyanobacteriorum]
MLKKLKLNPADCIIIGILLALLVSVRLFQDTLFYDPLIRFFKSDSKQLPDFNSVKLLAGLAFRYGINTVLSLGIVWFFFKDGQVVKLSAILYAIFFVMLLSAFYIVISSEEPNLLALFYVRRFLIQPLFLILFIPAVYYQKKLKQNP